MSSAGIALSWEYWKSAGHVILFAWLALLGIPLFFITGLHADGVAEASRFQELQMVYMIIAVPFLPFAALSGVGRIQRKFTLPVSSWKLTAYLMANGIMSVGFGTVFGAVVINLMFDVDWPWFKPALFLVLVYSFVFATCWSLTFSEQMKQLAGLLVGCVPCAGAVYLTLLTLRETPYYWDTMTWYELVGAVAGIAVAYPLAVWNFHTSRRGRGWPFAGAVDAVVGWWEGRPSNLPVGVTPMMAEAWYEWRGKSHLIPYGIAALGVVACLVALSGVVAIQVLVGIMMVLTWILFMVSGLYGIYLGACGESGDIRLFKATRPLIDRQLADGLLQNVMRSVVVIWGLWLTVLGLVFGCLWITGRTQPSFTIDSTQYESVAEFFQEAWPIVIGMVFFSWVMNTNGCVLVLMRRRAFLASLVSILFVPFGGLFVISFLVPIPYQVVVWTSFQLLIVAFLMFMVGLVYWKSLRRRCISQPRAVTLWLLTGVTQLAFYGVLIYQFDAPLWSFSVEALVGHLMLVTLACYCWLPWAAAPLAMWWNRHR